MGIARLSHNWLVNTLAAVYVEIVRNIPLLLQLLLVYAIIINVLPQPRESGELFGLVLLNTGGLFLPRALPQPGFGVFAVVSLLALAGDPARAALGRAQARAHRPAGPDPADRPRAAGADPGELLRHRPAAAAGTSR